jgi:outer membrane lipoprotein-sorting protein
MNRKICLLTMLVWAAAALSQTVAIGVPQFSADMVTTSPKGPAAVRTGKLYYGGTRFRMDMESEGRQTEVISDLPSKTGYVIMPQQHMYIEQKWNDMAGRRSAPEWKPYDPNDPCANREGTTCKKAGTEMVNGRMCDKWLITDKNAKTSTVWIDQKNHIPIKTINWDGTTMELKNIQEGTQSSSLFEIPAGYTKMDLGNMMRGMQGTQGPP